MASRRIEKNKSAIRKKDAKNQNKKRLNRRRSSVARIALVSVVLVAAAVATVLSLTVFFKIKSIDVYGESSYSSRQIISAAAVELETNLIRLNSEKVSQRIETKLPYIEEAKIRKRLPTTLEILVTKAQVAGYIETENGNYAVSDKGKILEKLAVVPEGMTTIAGVKLKDPKISEFISEDETVFKNITVIYSALGSTFSKNVTAVDVSDRINISFVYRDRITVKLGTETDLKEKLKFVSRILSDPEKINDDDIGVIHASNAKKISFLRKGSYAEYLESLEDETTSSDIAQTETEVTDTSSKGDTSSKATASNKTSSNKTSSKTSAQNTSSKNTSSKNTSLNNTSSVNTSSKASSSDKTSSKSVSSQRNSSQSVSSQRASSQRASSN